MKLLQTTGFSGEPFCVPADRIIAIQPCIIQRFINEEVEKTSGARLVVQDASPDGTAFMVRETYESVVKKLEEL